MKKRSYSISWSSERTDFLVTRSVEAEDYVSVTEISCQSFDTAQKHLLQLIERDKQDAR